MTVPSEPIIVPAWPFLVANHELGRVDYRTLVAPDFLGDQDASQVLAALPIDSDQTGPFVCELTYRGARREQCRLTLVYQVRSIPSESYFAVRPQRAVEILTGLVFLQPIAPLGVGAAFLDECFTLYEDDYRQFCRALPPHDFPVVLSWPLAITLNPDEVLSQLPTQDATRVHSRSITSRSAQTLPAQRAERAYAISRHETLAQIRTESFLAQLWRRLRRLSSH